MDWDKKYNIVYASDDNFSEIMGVSIVSLFHNNQDADNINLWILDSNISDMNKERVERTCEQYNRPLPHWITAINIEEKLNMKVQLDRGSFSQYARLFISSLLPEGQERVLYLDCDTIINQSIVELWNLDLKENTIGALMDAFSKYYRVNIDLQPEDIMFNSGVMLIDLKKWKERSIEDKLMSFIRKHKGKIQQGDQGALNAVLSHETFCFDPRFNSVTIFYDFTYKEMMLYRKPPRFYTEEQVDQAIEKPVIIHFTTSFLSRRPWIEGCQHKYINEWIKYKAMSKWGNEVIRKYIAPRGVKGLYTSTILKLPREIGIRISGVLQVYGRPLAIKICYR